MAEAIRKYEPNEAIFGSPRAQNGLNLFLSVPYMFMRFTRFRKVGVSCSHDQFTEWRDLVPL